MVTPVVTEIWRSGMGYVQRPAMATVTPLVAKPVPAGTGAEPAPPLAAQARAA